MRIALIFFKISILPKDNLHGRAQMVHIMGMLEMLLMEMHYRSVSFQVAPKQNGRISPGGLLTWNMIIK